MPGDSGCIIIVRHAATEEVEKWKIITKCHRLTNNGSLFLFFIFQTQHAFVCRKHQLICIYLLLLVSSNYCAATAMIFFCCCCIFNEIRGSWDLNENDDEIEWTNNYWHYAICIHQSISSSCRYLMCSFNLRYYCRCFLLLLLRFTRSYRKVNLFNHNLERHSERSLRQTGRIYSYIVYA